MWEKDRQLRELEERSQWRERRQVDSMIHPLALPNYPPYSGGERIVLSGGISAEPKIFLHLSPNFGAVML